MELQPEEKSGPVQISRHLIRHSLGRCPASFQRVATINSGYHHRTSADTTRFPACVGVSLVDSLWEWGGEAEPAFTVRRALSSTPGGSANNGVVQVPSVTRPS